MDVDFRHLPNPIGKKRLSAESPERNSKKSKSEVFDRYKTKLTGHVQVSSNVVSTSRLFGDEDTDLRQQQPVNNDRSSSINATQLSPMNKDKIPSSTVEITSPDVTIIDSDRPPTPPPPIISSSRDSPQRTDSSRRNLDVIRAKLANATNRNKLKSCKHSQIQNVHTYIVFLILESVY